MRKFRKALLTRQIPAWAFFLNFFLLAAPGLAETAGLRPVEAAELKTALVQYRAMTQLKVDFKQKKFLKDMDMALESKGELHIEPPDLVIYRITHPSRITVTLTPQAIKIENGSGASASVQTIKTGAIPGEAEKRSLQAMVTWLKLDPDALAREYSVSKDTNGNFRFEPRQADVSPFQSLQMQLSKSGHLARLTMLEKSGDRIEFFFDNPKVTTKSR